MGGGGAGYIERQCNKGAVLFLSTKKPRLNCKPVGRGTFSYNYLFMFSSKSKILHLAICSVCRVVFVWGPG